MVISVFTWRTLNGSTLENTGKPQTTMVHQRANKWHNLSFKIHSKWNESQNLNFRLVSPLYEVCAHPASDSTCLREANAVAFIWRPHSSCGGEWGGSCFCCCRCPVYSASHLTLSPSLWSTFPPGQATRVGGWLLQSESQTPAERNEPESALNQRIGDN